MLSLRQISFTRTFLFCAISIVLFSSTGFCVDSSVLFDFDGDGKTDISVYRMGAWTTTNRAASYFYIRSSLTGELIAAPFGAGGDRPAVSDYDRDGIADLAVFRSWDDALEFPWLASDYWVRRSSTGLTDVNYFLGHGTIVSRDFVGDNRPEFGVFTQRFVEGSDPDNPCYIPGFLIGRNDDIYQKDISENCLDSINSRIPALGDYDGDGVSDIAILNTNASSTRGSSYFQVWHSPLTSGLTEPDVIKQFPADFPLPGDYDCDGKTDFAGGRFENGRLVWRMLFSSNNFLWTVTFGITGDKPVPGDYDGDGKTDQAVFRPSEGNWYILRSSDWNWEMHHFGIATDVPIPQPNAF